jgi:hypothetical protein
MAEFVTRKEAQRRLWTVVVCAIFSVIALAVGLLNYKGASDEEKLDQANTVAKLRREVSGLQEQNQAARNAYLNFSTPIGWRPDQGNVSLRPADAMSGLAGISPANLRKYLDTWVTDRFPQLDIKGYKAWEGAEGSGKELTLVELWTRLIEKEKDLRSKIAALEAERDQNEKAGGEYYLGTVEEDKRIVNEFDQKNTGLRDSFTNKLTQLRNDEKRYRLELDGDGSPANKGLSGQVIELQMKLTELINEHLNLRVQLAQQRKELENRINWIIYRAEEARERKEPDGEILAVESAQGIGFIDLVHHDRIFRGGRFKVYSLEKGGEKRDKGEVEILEVAKERASKVAVYSTDLDNPIQPGDKIYNETYERGKARNIAIAGRLSGKLSNEDAIRRIKEFGDVYQERVTEKTNYLIVGEGYENDPNFALSKEYAVKIMIEKIFQEYLGVPQ